MTRFSTERHEAAIVQSRRSTVEGRFRHGIGVGAVNRLHGEADTTPHGCTDETGRGPMHLTLVACPPQAAGVSDPASAMNNASMFRQRIRLPPLWPVRPGFPSPF